MTESEVQQMIKQDRELYSDTAHHLFMMLWCAFILIMVLDIIVGIEPIMREDSHGRSFLCWSDQKKDRRFLKNTRELSLSESCVVVDHVRPLGTK